MYDTLELVCAIACKNEHFCPKNCKFNVFLKEKKILGAGLDVFDEEPYSGHLTKLDNVVLTPHIGAYSKGSNPNVDIAIQFMPIINQLLRQGLDEKTELSETLEVIEAIFNKIKQEENLLVN